MRFKKTIFAFICMTMMLCSCNVNAKTINMGTFKLTAFCPCKSCSGKWGNQTYSGKTAKEGVTVAADLSVMNIGDTVTIDGKEYVVEDRGNGVVGDHLDIFFESHEDVENFGVKYGDVRIIR